MHFPPKHFLLESIDGIIDKTVKEPKPESLNISFSLSLSLSLSLCCVPCLSGLQPDSKTTKSMLF